MKSFLTVGEMGIDEMGTGKTGVGEMGVSKMETSLISQVTAKMPCDNH